MDQTMESSDTTFDQYRIYLEHETDTRDAIKKYIKQIGNNGIVLLSWLVLVIENLVRQMNTTLSLIHHQIPQVVEICARVRSFLPQIQQQFAGLQSSITKETYYKFHDSWKNLVCDLVTILGVIVFLESQKLITKQQVENLLNGI